ncbi:MAG: hypothetical protein ACR2NU_12075 [Aeoliella sp.]
MAAIGPLKYAYLALFSKPKRERLLYKHLRSIRGRRIVEVGIGSIDRAVRLVSVAQRFHHDNEVSYTGLDWFEEREVGAAPMPLIHAHRQLQLTAARVRLVPGFPTATLPQIANSLQRTDLILISSQLNDAALDRVWFYLPRMCHSNTVVLRETLVSDGDESDFEQISIAELKRKAAVRDSRQAA